MPKIPLTPRQFQHLAIVSAQIDELSKKREAFLEIIVDSCEEARGRNIVLKTPFEQDGIEFEFKDDEPKLIKE